MPEGDAPRIGPRDPERFINRELSWLDFNLRVVEEAENASHPLLERVRFLSISAGNLDEFYSVRVAGLIGQAREGIKTVSPDGRTPAQQLEAVTERARALIERQQADWRMLRATLAENGMTLLDPERLSETDRAWAETWFNERVFPVLTPLAIDPAHPFPFIPNMGLVLGFQLARLDDNQVMRGLIPLPSVIERFIRLPNQGEGVRFVLLESLVSLFVDRVFPGFAIRASGLFRLIRDTDVEFEDEAEDLVHSYETALKRRRRGVVIHLAVDAAMEDEFVAFVADELEMPASRRGPARRRAARPRRHQERHPVGPHGTAVPALRAALPRSASATSAATASPPSAPRTSSSTTRSRASTWWCSSSARPHSTPPSWPSSRRSIAPAATARSSRP